MFLVWISNELQIATFNRQLSDLIGQFSAINLMGDLTISRYFAIKKRLLRWSQNKSQSWLEISLIGHQMCMEKRDLNDKWVRLSMHFTVCWNLPAYIKSSKVTFLRLLFLRPASGRTCVDSYPVQQTWFSHLPEPCLHLPAETTHTPHSFSNHKTEQEGRSTCANPRQRCQFFPVIFTRWQCHIQRRFSVSANIKESFNNILAPEADPYHRQNLRKTFVCICQHMSTYHVSPSMSFFSHFVKSFMSTY